MKRKAFRLFALVALLSMTTGAWAQWEFATQKKFNKYSSLWKKKLGMDMKIPKDFQVGQLDYDKWPFNTGHSCKGLNVPGGVVFSGNKDKMIVYPCGLVISMSPEARRGILSLASVLEKEANTTVKREVLTNRQFCNADTVIIAEQALDAPYINNYTHLVTILTQKKHYMPLYFRIFMDETGYKGKDETIKALLGSVNYIDVKDYNTLEENIINYANSVDSKATGTKPGKLKFDRQKSSAPTYDPDMRIK